MRCRLETPEKYVNDVLSIVINLPLGSRFNKDTKKITKSEEDVLEDRSQGKTKEQVTMDVLRHAANSIQPFLEFTSEHASGEDQTVPCLDTQF